MSSIMAATGGLMVGYDIGVFGGVTSMNDFLKKFFPKVHSKKNDNQSLQHFTSSMYLAGFTATIFACYASGRLGRRFTMLITGFFFIGGVVFNGAAQDFGMLIVGRILLGCGVGFANHAFL